MQSTVYDSVYTYLVPCLCDVLAGFGLCALLEFSRTSPEMHHLLAVCLGVLLALGVSYYLVGPYKRVPAWLALCNTTYSLVLTLSLSLNLLAQLCPPSGRDLALLPVYALLCVPRIQPSCKALLMQAGETLLLVGAFVMLPTSRHVRPSGDVGGGLTLALSLAAAAGLQTFEWRDDYLFCQGRDSRWMAASVVCKGLILVLLGTLKDTSLYHFMHDRPSNVPKELLVAYGTLLLYACMQTASVWFGQLKEALGSQAKWRLVVRIQHIIYALLVAAAWAYPLQLHALRLLVLSGLLGLNAMARLF